jgi:ribosomal protein S18 acetylase RimI-like enzyme
MAEFYVSLTDDDMAAQVARMLNLYNRWATTFSALSIKLTPARYFVELNMNKVVGCASNIRDYPTLTKIQHICVLPDYRNRGIAKKLTELAIKHAETEYVYMTIREDNAPSIGLATSLGFRYVQKHSFRDHWTLTFGRRTHESAGVQNQLCIR